MHESSFIDADLAAWAQCGRVSVTVAAPGPENRPTIGAGFGCKISADRRRVTVFLGLATSSDTVAAIRARGVIAVVLTESATVRSVQLKASDATVRPLAPGDRDHMRAHVDGLARTWASVGQPEEWTRSLLDPDAEEVLAVTFTPDAAFDQTPGPRAGTLLKDGA